MISVILWLSVTAIAISCLQWMLLFRKSKGTKGERAVFVVIMAAATLLHIMQMNDWFTTSPLNLIRAVFSPASQALQQWGLVGKE